jgi:hypothetical protein
MISFHVQFKNVDLRNRRKAGSGKGAIIRKGRSTSKGTKFQFGGMNDQLQYMVTTVNNNM